jgi:hypothetical protein
MITLMESGPQLLTGAQLRCSCERPICSRCTRLSAACSYPSPPNRKLLASARAATRKRKAESKPAPNTNGHIGKRMNRNVPSHQPDSAPAPSQTSESSISTAQYTLTNSQATDIFLPEPIEQLLRDVYFTCLFNAELLFHREEFNQALSQGRIPRNTVLMAMYSMASKYFVPISASTCDTQS